MLSTENLKPPLPIDWEVPTRGCNPPSTAPAVKLATSISQILAFAISYNPPSSLKKSRSGRQVREEIGWLQFKGDPQKEPSKKHPFEYGADDWDSPTNLYNIDLVIGKDNEFVRNVMSEYYVRVARPM
jgi:hypothetical protein